MREMRETSHSIIPGFTIRFATEEDCELILMFIKDLAVFVKAADEVVATVDGLRDSLFTKRQAEVIIGEQAGEPVAFALFFTNYSTYLGKGNLYLEDLFVKESHRGAGYGKALLQYLAALAVARGCGRIDWGCLDWNRGALDFYKSLGAVTLDGWIVHRLYGEALAKLAGTR